MCGIFGIWKTDGSAVDLEKVATATSSLRHRGPDDEGYLLVDTRAGRLVECGGTDTDPRLNLRPISAFAKDRFDLALGFRRLSILDPSPLGHQPMSSPDRRFWIVFNGAVYNHAAIRTGLSGFHPRSQTDTEVVLAAFERLGRDAFGRFNGMWAIAIWDAKDRRLLLSRDRLGVKPLYYRDTGPEIAFASEAKALVGRHGRRFAPNRRAVFDYLSTGRLPDASRGNTFFEGVQALPAGTCMSVGSDGERALAPFWTLKSSAPLTPALRSAEDVAEELRTLFADAVRVRLAADVPVGSCLSGGLDSSAIVCTINQLMVEQPAATGAVGARQLTFSAVFPGESRIDERHYIELVLKSTQVESNWTKPTVEALHRDLRRLVWHQEEPFRSTSVFAQWCVMATAHERGVKVLLDGQGADELLGGYGPTAFHLADLAARGLPRELAREAAAMHDRSLASIGPLLAQLALAALPATWSEALRDAKATRARDLSVVSAELAREFIGQPAARVPNGDTDLPLSRHLRESVRETSLPHLLRYEDRSSMAHGIESRLPFLDYRLVELCFGEAAPWRLHRGWTKWILRKALERTVPPEIAWRRDKVAFETPERDWLRRWSGLMPDLMPDSPLCATFMDLQTARKQFGGMLDSQEGPSLAWRWINLSTWLSVFEAA